MAKEIIEVNTTDGKTHTFENTPRGVDQANKCAINDITAYAKQYGHPDKVKGMRVARCDDEVFMVDMMFTEILSPAISIDYLLDPNG